MAHAASTIPLPGQALGGDSGSLGGQNHAPQLCAFVAGPENQLALAAVNGCLESVAIEPAWRHHGTQGDCRALEKHSLYNPLVLYGPSGSGKSHLVHGLAEQWKQRHPGDTVFVLGAAEFARQYAQSVEHRQSTAWRTRYRKASLLIIEDLTQLTDKPMAQVELLQMIDAVILRRGLLVVTARIAPRQIAGLLPGLVSRLTAGLAVPVVLPAVETRLVVVRRLAGARGVSLGEEVARVLVDRLPVSVPELLGAVLALQKIAQLHGTPVDLNVVERYLATRTPPAEPSLRDVAKHCGRYFGLKVGELKGRSRFRAVVLARNVAMYLARQQTLGSLKEIGVYFGGRDHTTVLHACRKTASLLKTDDAVRDAVSKLQQTLATVPQAKTAELFIEPNVKPEGVPIQPRH